MKTKNEKKTLDVVVISFNMFMFDVLVVFMAMYRIEPAYFSSFVLMTSLQTGYVFVGPKIT